MAFFQSLPLDLKMLFGGVVLFALLALFSGNRKAERNYLVVLAVLAAIGFYRFEQTSAAETSAAPASTKQFVTSTPKHTPLQSTFAK